MVYACISLRLLCRQSKGTSIDIHQKQGLHETYISLLITFNFKYHFFLYKYISFPFLTSFD